MKGKHTIRFIPGQCIVYVILSILLGRDLCAQEIPISQCPTRTDSLLLIEPDRSVLQSVVEWMLPESIAGILAMKAFIRRDTFQSFCRDSGDRRAVDLMFQKALIITRGDIDEALLICFVGAMDHKEFGIHIPLLGFTIFFPLTTESDQSFQERQNHLPSHFYPDSPKGKYGDRDKLQHFFGSALMAYLSGSGTYADALGGWTEILEQRYVIDGLDDPRDRRANQQGVRFGKILLDGMSILPGDVLIDSVYNHKEDK